MRRLFFDFDFDYFQKKVLGYVNRVPLSAQKVVKTFIVRLYLIISCLLSEKQDVICLIRIVDMT